MAREMKDSGIGWVHEIPNNWNIVRGKYLFSSQKKVVGTKVENYERLALTLNGVVKRSKEDNEGLQPDKFDGYQILQKDELVFKLIDLQNVSTSRVGLSPYDGIVSPAYIVLESNGNILPAFAEKYYLSMWMNEVFNALGDAGVRSSINAQELLDIYVPMPPIQEQHCISSFLDSKCSEIDALSADIQSEIDKLEEYKKSVITEAVTKGLDKNMEMKDSGVEWIGKIPKTFSIGALKYYIDSMTDVDHFMPDTTEYGGYPYLMIGDLKDFASMVQIDKTKHISSKDFEV